MKIKLLMLASLICAAVSFSGCATYSKKTTDDWGPGAVSSAPASSGFAAVAEVLGPPIATVANERLALAILKGHPGRESTLRAISNDLSLLTAGTNVGEITDKAIETFVAVNAAKWGLLPGETDLVIAGLKATRAQYLSSTNSTVVLLSDPRVTVYITAIRRGIEQGIADNAARQAK